VNRKAVLAALTEFEGNVSHMYLCTGGEVTVGVGHALESIEDACTLGWRIGARPATREEIAADYRAVSSAEMSHTAAFYKKVTKCSLDDPAIAALVDDDITKFEAELRTKLVKWETYPETVQQALFDMAYNLGVNGLLKKFPKMFAAVNSGDWETAAKECRRNGIADQRNAATAELFRVATGSRAVRSNL